MNKPYLIIIALLLTCAVSAFGAESAAQVLDKAVARTGVNSTVDCKFQVKSDTGSVSGALKMTGRKFKLETPHATSWFDGKNMWTANPSTKEITIVNPTSQEVRESNPMEYIHGYKADYRVYFSKRKDPARYLILLNPKAKKSEIKAIEIALNKSSLLPERIIIRDKNDKRTTVTISSMSIKSQVKDANYVCPVDKMSDFEVVDLR